MSNWGWKPYVPAAARRAKAAKAATKVKKDGVKLQPIAPYRGAIAKTFWGKAWCQNLERYSDFANRLPRGRTYVRNGSVIDLRITSTGIRAQVMGSRLYTVDATVSTVPTNQWQAIVADCTGSIDSLVELLQGRLSNAVMERICKPGLGLFPAPSELQFSCTCPDWASMCKHVAAVLYGVGTRLDREPELLFVLRQVDAKDLVAQAGAGVPQVKSGTTTKRILVETELADVFGIEMAEIAPRKLRERTAPAAKSDSSRPKLPRLKPAKRPVTSKSTAKKQAAARKSQPAKAMPKTSSGVTDVVNKVVVRKTGTGKTPSARKPRKAQKTTKH
jgi:uncharacterized Zn finger protein